MRSFLPLIFCLLTFNAFAQDEESEEKKKPVILTGHGVSLAYQQGSTGFAEIGIEKYWEQFVLKSPRTTAFSAGIIYNPVHNIGGVNTNIWTRKGRLSYTFGGSVAYYNDFKNNHKLTVGPAFGYRLLGLHLTIGYNVPIGNTAINKVNSFYAAARIYIPVKRRFKFDEKELEERRNPRDKREAKAGGNQQYF